MSNQNQITKSKIQDREYDLEDRTGKYGEAVIKFSKQIPHNPINSPLISQIVRSATSIGANYCEADGAESKRDFKHKISLCKKEAKETKHWLRMISSSEPNLKDEAKILWKEAQELTLIFSAIIRNIKKK